VEALTHRHDLVASAVLRAPLARELDRRLVGLRAGVAEENLAFETGNLNKLLREL
jgi:hypothetical protein